MTNLISRSFINALATALYIAGVATVMENGEKIFGEMDNVSGPVAFLLLFVLSAAITSSLVLGKPILMYLNNQKSEALKLFFYTLAWLALGVIILFFLNIKW